VFFEGPEKKLELWVRSPTTSLRSFGRPFWTAVVQTAGARILSALSNDHCDAYLLSESSLFVYDQRLLMITCGRTNLVAAVPAIAKRLSVDDIDLLIYERKSQYFPEHQPTTFFEDVRLLHTMLPGSAFRYGDDDEHHVFLFHHSRPGFRAAAQDSTLEILMYNWDPAVAGLFSEGSQHRPGPIRDESGVGRILPGYQIDDFAFAPMGYSMNAIRENTYYTVHVTPEPQGSYASFETNHRFESEIDRNVCIQKLLAIFRPDSFDVLYFLQTDSEPLVDCGYQHRRSMHSTLPSGYSVFFKSFFLEHAASEPAEELSI
jgi:S-adenosylmethionine decarboxylase